MQCFLHVCVSTRPVVPFKEASTIYYKYLHLVALVCPWFFFSRQNKWFEREDISTIEHTERVLFQVYPRCVVRLCHEVSHRIEVRGLDGRRM